MHLELVIAFLILFLAIWLFYTRHLGSEYGPTTMKRARRMIEFAKITKKDIVYDLGSGFGGLAIMASRRAKKVVGIEYDFLRYFFSIIRAFFHGARNVGFIRGNLFKQGISNADVIFLFLKQKTNQKLKAKLKKLNKGARVVSNTWTFENWKPARQDKNLKVYMYVVGEE
ncbi:SAM-dependent methyltransferase [Candidatus Pacearchaeota archaeon]|nr:SAM-dependent methyltransferase [Candidatus Pacearchaeota archaeon]